MAGHGQLPAGNDAPALDHDLVRPELDHAMGRWRLQWGIQRRLDRDMMCLCHCIVGVASGMVMSGQYQWHCAREVFENLLELVVVSKQAHRSCCAWIAGKVRKHDGLVATLLSFRQLLPNPLQLRLAHGASHGDETLLQPLKACAVVDSAARCTKVIGVVLAEIFDALLHRLPGIFLDHVELVSIENKHPPARRYQGQMLGISFRISARLKL